MQFVHLATTFPGMKCVFFVRCFSGASSVRRCDGAVTRSIEDGAQGGGAGRAWQSDGDSQQQFTGCRSC